MPDEALFKWYSKLLGLGRQISFGAFGVFSADLSALFWLMEKLIYATYFQPVADVYYHGWLQKHNKVSQGRLQELR